MTSPTGKLSLQAWMTAPETTRVMEALGPDARFVGGCVRNALVNRKVIDIDIATPLPPEEVIERLKEHKLGFAPTGLAHGTVTAIADGQPFEVTTLRRDVKSHGRHADVAFTDDWQEDAARRDFTMNALYATTAGEVFDYFGGIQDLHAGRVIFVGDPHQRIEEDVLRILRFFRFFAHFGKGAPDAAALSACVEKAGLIPRLSPERIRQETLKLLESDRCAEVWKLMMAQKIAGLFLPEARNVIALENLIVLENEYGAGGFVLRRLAALLEGDAEKTASSLRLSNEQTAQLSQMANALPSDPVRALVYRLGNDMTRNLLLLAAAREGQPKDFDASYATATSFRAPRFPLTGEDVLSRGISPGPAVGAALSAVESWWIENDFQPGRTACLEKLAAVA